VDSRENPQEEAVIIVNSTDPRAAQLPLILPITHIFLHHCSLAKAGADNPRPIPDALLTGLNLSLEFERNRALGTGCMRPYHVLIRQDGTVDQCLKLMLRGSHGIIYNSTTLAVVTAGEAGLTPEQRAVLPAVLADMLLLTDGSPIVGHTSMPAATRPGHPICPHPTTDVQALTNEAMSLVTNPQCVLTFDQRAQALRLRGWAV
jgi:hypothetical protein